MDAVYFWRGTVYERHVNLDQLAAGRELDELVQARVMVDDHTSKAPRYSASFSASAQLEARLNALGWKRVGSGSRPGRASDLPITVQLRHADGSTVNATAEAFEEALCKAALKACRT